MKGSRLSSHARRCCHSESRPCSFQAYCGQHAPFPPAQGRQPALQRESLPVAAYLLESTQTSPPRRLFQRPLREHQTDEFMEAPVFPVVGRTHASRAG